MRLLLLFVVALAGCQGPENVELLSECFSVAAYEAVRAEASVVDTQPQKCCGKCKGGMVKSGDGLAWVSCPCPDTCQCKAVTLPAKVQPR